jgi:hypothetical protein
VSFLEHEVFAIPVDAFSKDAAHRIVVIDRRQVVLLGLLFIGALALVWAYPRSLMFYGCARQLAIAARRRYAEGAAPAWRALRRTTRESSPQHITPALYRWMDRSYEFG